MKRDSELQARNILEGESDTPPFVKGEKVTFYDDTKKKWVVGVVLEDQAPPGTDGRVSFNVRTPEAVRVQVTYEVGGADAAQKILFDKGQTAMIDVAHSSTGAELSRTSYLVEKQSIEKDGSIFYDIVEKQGTSATGKEIAKHIRVPQELLEMYRRVLVMRQRAHAIERQVEQKAHQHRAALTTQSTEVAAAIQSIFDALPEVADMNKAVSQELGVVSEQIAASHASAEELLQDLEDAVQAVDDVTSPEAATAHIRTLTATEKAELLQYTKDIAAQIKAAEAQVESASATQIPNPDPKVDWKTEYNDLIQDIEDNVIEKDDKKLEYEDKLTEIDDGKRNKIPAKDIKALEKEKKTIEKERKKLQDEGVKLETKRKSTMRDQVVSDMLDGLENGRTNGDAHATQLLNQIDESRVAVHKIQTTGLVPRTVNGREVFDFENDAVARQRNLTILKELVTAGEQEDFSAFTLYNEAEGALNFDTHMAAMESAAAALLATVVAADVGASTTTFERRIKGLQKDAAKAAKRLVSLAVARKQSSLEFGTSASVADPSTLTHEELLTLRSSVTTELDARLAALHSDWATVERAQAPEADREAAPERRDALAIDTRVLLEITKERLPHIRTTMRELYTNGNTPEAKQGFAEMFDGITPDPVLLDQIAKAGIGSFDDFITLWKGGLSDTVTDVMHESSQSDLKHQVAAKINSWDKIKSELGPTGLKYLKNAAMFGGTAFGIGAAFAVLPFTIPAAGFVAAGLSGGIVGKIRGWRRRKNDSTKKEQEAARDRLAKMLKSKEKEVIEGALAYRFGADGVPGDTLEHRFDQLPMFAQVINQTIKDQTAPPSMQVHGVELGGDAYRLYRQALEQLDPKDKTEANEMRLVKALAEMRNNGNILEQVQAKYDTLDPRAHNTFEANQAVLDEATSNSDAKNSMSDGTRGALWSMATYGAAATVGGSLTRLVLGGAMGAWSGSKNKDTKAHEYKVERAKSNLDTVMDAMHIANTQVRNSNSPTSSQKQFFADNLNRLRKVANGTAGEVERTVYDKFFDMSGDTPKETAYYKQFKAMLADAEALNIERGIVFDKETDRASLDALLASVQNTTISANEQASDDAFNSEVEKQGKKVGYRHVLEQAGIGAARAFLVGGAFALGMEGVQEQIQEEIANRNVIDIDDIEKQIDPNKIEEPVVEPPVEPHVPEVETYNPNIDAHGNRLIHTDTIEDGGSVWRSLDRLYATQQEAFKEMGIENRDEYRSWRSDQLEDMGYVRVDGQWGHPVTVHEGAQIEMYADTNGELHARIIDPTGDTVDVRDTLHFRSPSVDTEALEHVLNTNVEAPSETLDGPGEAYNEAFYDTGDVNDDGFTSADERADLFDAANTNTEDPLTFGEIDAHLDANAALTSAESAWVGSLTEAASDAGYSSDTLLEAIDAAGDANGSFESQELKDFVRSSDRSPSAFIGLLESLGGTSAMNASDIAAMPQSSFDSTFATNNPDLAPGVEPVAANTNVETFAAELSMEEFSVVTREVSTSLDNMRNFEFDTQSSREMFANFETLMNNALHNDPSLLATQTDALGNISLDIYNTLYNLGEQDPSFEVLDYAMLYADVSVINPVVAEGGQAMAYYQNGETHVLHHPNLHFKTVEGGIDVWPHAGTQADANFVTLEDIPDLLVQFDIDRQAAS